MRKTNYHKRKTKDKQFFRKSDGLSSKTRSINSRETCGTSQSKKITRSDSEILSSERFLSVGSNTHWKNFAVSKNVPLMVDEIVSDILQENTDINRFQNTKGTPVFLEERDCPLPTNCTNQKYNPPLYSSPTILTQAEVDNIITRTACTLDEWKSVIIYAIHIAKGIASVQPREALPDCERSESISYLQIWCTLKGIHEGWYTDLASKQREIYKSYMIHHTKGCDIDICALWTLKAIWYITRKSMFLRYLKSFADDVGQPQATHDICYEVYTECIQKYYQDKGWEYTELKFEHPLRGDEMC